MKKRGVGMGCMWYGVGNTGLPNPAGAHVDILDDGTVLVLTGCADIGQGSDTALAQIAAEEIGVRYEDVRVVSADTGVTPDAGATSASRQTYISGNAVRSAARAAKQLILETAAEMLGVSQEEIIAGDRLLKVRAASGKSQAFTDCQSECRVGLGLDSGSDTREVSIAEVIAKCRMKGKLTLGHGWYNPDTTGLDAETGQGRPYATYAFATQVAEVEVDEDTGEVTVLRVVAAHDVGRAINPRNVEGQIEGGCAIGMGYALMEEIKLQEGNVLNCNFATYLLPTSLDVPEIYPLIVEDPEKTGPFGAKGVGEPALIPTAAAIANAVYDAVGVRITDLPITPDKILAKLKEKQNKGA
ncbi:MAG: molybdopterin-dependent oxidoreductase [Negativicutes bacterium]|nr:molybdopterin-dependent oxidoreductase [Negativicutes bacterium]